jgi:transposase
LRRVRFAKQKENKAKKRAKAIVYREYLRKLIGANALYFGLSSTSERMGVSRSLAYYYRRKILDPTFHPRKHGGRRYTKFSAAERANLEMFLWQSCKLSPCAFVSVHCKRLRSVGFEVNAQYVKRIFAKWQWNYKKPEVKQIHKYSSANMLKYSLYLSEIYFIPYDKLKFLDETHIVHKDLAFNKAIGPIGEPMIVVNKRQLDTRITLTIMSTLSDPELTTVADI